MRIFFVIVKLYISTKCIKYILNNMLKYILGSQINQRIESETCYLIPFHFFCSFLLSAYCIGVCQTNTGITSYYWPATISIWAGNRPMPFWFSLPHSQPGIVASKWWATILKENSLSAYAYLSTFWFSFSLSTIISPSIRWPALLRGKILDYIYLTPNSYCP